jgi:hypothetical protein
MSLMPCFDANQAQAEGIIVGRLLAGYGELEVQLCACRIAVEGIYDIPVRELFSVRGESRRLRTAKAALRSDYTRAGLITDLDQALDDLDWCREIRNQYSHCQWYWTSKEGLCFVNLEELAKQPTAILALTAVRHPISLALLNDQEAFFWYVKECLMYLETAYRDWDRLQGLTPGPAIFLYPKPTVVARPPAHN